MPRILHPYIKEAIILVASLVMLAGTLSTPVHAAAPSGYGGFTATTEPLSSSCPIGDTSCGTSDSAGGFFQRSVVIGGETFFQTIVVPTVDTSTGTSDDTIPLQFAHENFIQGNLHDSLDWNDGWITVPQAPVMPYMEDYALLAMKHLSGEVPSASPCEATTVLFPFPSLNDIPIMAAVADSRARIEYKIVDGACGAEGRYLLNAYDMPLPSVSFGLDQVVVEGGVATVPVYRSGRPVNSIEVSYTVRGTATPDADHGGASGTVTLPPYTKSAEISFPVYEDTEDDDGETVVITLQQPSNATLGEKASQTITLSEQRRFLTVNLKALMVDPDVSTRYSHLYLLSGCCSGEADPLVIQADVRANYAHSTLQYDWSGSDPALLAVANSAGNVLSFYPDRQLMPAGIYIAKVKVTEPAHSGVVGEAELPIKVVTDIDVTTWSWEYDSDSDGAMNGDDAIIFDVNGNGIPDYLDVFRASYTLQMHQQPTNGGNTKLERVLDDGTQVSIEWFGFLNADRADARLAITSDIGTRLRLGRVALALGTNGAVVPADMFGQQAAASHPELANLQTMEQLLGDSIIDAEVTELATPGQSVHIVVPISTLIQSDAIAWVYNPVRGWGRFWIDINNDITVAEGLHVGELLFSCPGWNDAAFTEGAGTECMRLTVEDGGPNDADGVQNGTVALMLAAGPDILEEVAAPVAANSDSASAVSNVSTNVTGGGGAFSIFVLILLTLGFTRKIKIFQQQEHQEHQGVGSEILKNDE